MGDKTKPNWLHGIENLTKDWEGYVYWKGIHIEHYSFNDKESEASSAKTLGIKCLDLESRGIEVSCCSAVYKYELYSGTDSKSPWIGCIDKYYTVFENEKGKAEFVILGNCNHGVALGVDDDGSEVCILEKDGEFESGVFKLFHMLQEQGYSSCVKRLEDYDSFVTVMGEIGITGYNVDRAIEITSNPENFGYLRAGNGRADSYSFVNTDRGEFVEFNEASIVDKRHTPLIDGVTISSIDSVLDEIIELRDTELKIAH